MLNKTAHNETCKASSTLFRTVALALFATLVLAPFANSQGFQPLNSFLSIVLILFLIITSFVPILMMREE